MGIEKAKTRINNNIAIVHSLKDGLPNSISSDDLCIFLTPSSSIDYSSAKSLALNNNIKTIIINGYAKDAKSIPDGTTMAYYLKPLTYNSQIAGYLIRAYPKNWITISDATVLSDANDIDILVKGTNTPDLRPSVSLVSKFVSDRAILLRKQQQ